MIVQSLVKRYDEIIAKGGAVLAPAGYSVQKVGFEIVINKDGSLHDIVRVMDKQSTTRVSSLAGKKIQVQEFRERPRELLVLGQSKSSGSGLNPCFLWDSAEYMIGFKPDAANPERTQAAFRSFRDKHLLLRSEIGDQGFHSVCKFLESWSPSVCTSITDLEKIVTFFGVFRIRGDREFLHERSTIRAWWDSQQQARAAERRTEAVPSLSNGRHASIARIHEPRIKGISGAQTSGATVVSFNQVAFESFGKSQGANAPLGIDDAFKYCTALNQLVTNDAHRVRIGPDTYVFWIDGVDDEAIGLAAFASILDVSSSATNDRLRSALTNSRAGKLFADLSDDRTFFVLGLAPNMARLSVRMWLQSSVKDIRARLKSHADGLSIKPIQDRDDLPSIRALVLESVSAKSGFPDADRLNPGLAPELARSILEGTSYPRALFAGIVQRVRVEGLADKETRKDHREAAWRRCSFIRAYLTRNCKMEVPVALDTDRKDTPYLLGRLFAVLERVQENAMGKALNRTIKETFYASASTTPAGVFPRLLKLTNHHLSKIEYPGQRILRERELAAIMNEMHAFPSTLSLEAQGLYAIGYYHQRQTYFQKADQPHAEAPTES